MRTALSFILSISFVTAFGQDGHKVPFTGSNRKDTAFSNHVIVSDSPIYAQGIKLGASGGGSTPLPPLNSFQWNNGGALDGSSYLKQEGRTVHLSGKFLADDTVTLRGDNINIGITGGKLGCFSALPVVKQSGDIITAFRNYGLITSGTYNFSDLVNRPANILTWGVTNVYTKTEVDSIVAASGGGAVSSVNGLTGAVNLVTSDIDEAGDNLYWTIARTDAQIYSDTTTILAYTKSLARDYLQGFGLQFTANRTIGVDTFLIPTRNRLQKIVDSLDVIISAMGTVTGVSSGYGTNFTTINTTGNVIVDSFVIASKNRLYKVRDSIISIGYLTSESDPVASAKTVTIATGYGLTGGGSAQSLSVNPSRTIVADSTLLSTKAYRQKGIDSVAAYAKYTVSYGLGMSILHDIYADSFVIASKNRLYKVRDSLASIGYLTAETDPIASAKTVTVGSGWGITGGGSAQALSANPSRTLAADSSVISTWGYRKKGDDSVAAIAATKLSANQIVTLNGAVSATGVLTSALVTTLNASVVGTANLSATGTASAITYLRGDNTWATPSGGSGTVTSIAVSVPTDMTVSGTPVTISGTITISHTGLNTITDAANFVFNGSNGSTQVITLGANRTFTISNLLVGVTYRFIVNQDGTGSRALTWGTTVKAAWGYSGTPPISTTASAQDVYELWTDGTTVHAKVDLNWN